MFSLKPDQYTFRRRSTKGQTIVNLTESVFFPQGNYAIRRLDNASINIPNSDLEWTRPDIPIDEDRCGDGMVRVERGEKLSNWKMVVVKQAQNVASTMSEGLGQENTKETGACRLTGDTQKTEVCHLIDQHGTGPEFFEKHFHDLPFYEDKLSKSKPPKLSRTDRTYNAIVLNKLWHGYMDDKNPHCMILPHPFTENRKKGSIEKDGDGH